MEYAKRTRSSGSNKTRTKYAERPKKRCVTINKWYMYPELGHCGVARPKRRTQIELGHQEVTRNKWFMQTDLGHQVVRERAF